MVLKDYINFEKTIDHPNITVTHFESYAPIDDLISISCSNNICIFLNIGNMLSIKQNNRTLLVPPKNAFLINNEKFEIEVKKGKYIKYTIIEFKDNLNILLNNNIISSVNEEFRSIFSKQSYIFDFPLNIDILSLIEEIYKIDFISKYPFVIFEIKAKSFYLIFLILKKILFMDFKYIDPIATDYYKYYGILKNIVENCISLENALSIYNLELSVFNQYFNFYNETTNIEEYINKYVKYEQL